MNEQTIPSLPEGIVGMNKSVPKNTLNQPPDVQQGFSPVSALDGIITSSSRIRNQEDSTKSRAKKFMENVDAHESLTSSIDNIMQTQGNLKQNANAMNLSKVRSMLGINPS